MHKYIVISDISKYPCYKNVNCRLIYLHIACNVDTSVYDYCQSYRGLAMELDMSVDAVRHAIKQLVRDGLITTHVAPHTATQYAPQSTPQPLTHLHIVNNRDLGTPNGTPNTTPITTPNTTISDTDSTTHLKINNNIKSLDQKKYSLARAREEFLDQKYIACVATYCNRAYDTAEKLTNKWILSMSLKKKEEWNDKTDAWQHCLDWCNKHKNTIQL